MVAAVARNCTLLSLLLDAGADINQETQKGRDGNLTALMRATQLDHINAACFLIDRGASLENSQGKWFDTPKSVLGTKAQRLAKETQAARSVLKTLIPLDIVNVVASYTQAGSKVQCI